MNNKHNDVVRQALLDLTDISFDVYISDVEAHSSIDLIVSNILTLRKIDWEDKNRSMKEHMQRIIQTEAHAQVLNNKGDWIYLNKSDEKGDSEGEE